MRRQADIREEILGLVREYYSAIDAGLGQSSGRYEIPLCIPSYGPEEVSEVLDSLLSTYVTMGAKVRRFEREFASYLGGDHGIMVNSGSSANLLALSILTNRALDRRIDPGDEIITPAVTWGTTIFPIVNVGATPVLVDADLETYNVNVDAIERAISPRTKAILVVHLVGNPCNMTDILGIARKHDLLVIEDSCEAHGAEWRGQKVGTFGDISTFSFYFSHHITTIEGGMIVTSRYQYDQLARSLRAHGWVRDLDDRERIADEYPDIDPRFMFVNVGYNVRPTEIQGGFGIHQLEKLESNIAARRDNANYWTKALRPLEDFLILPKESPDSRHVWLGYPLTVRRTAPFSRDELVEFLEGRGVETRPIVAGNIAEHPVMRSIRGRIVGDLQNARFIMRNAFWIGTHQGVTPERREAVVDYINEFVTTKLYTPARIPASATGSYPNGSMRGSPSRRDKVRRILS